MLISIFEINVEDVKVFVQTAYAFFFDRLYIDNKIIIFVPNTSILFSKLLSNILAIYVENINQEYYQNIRTITADIVIYYRLEQVSSYFNTGDFIT